MYVILVKRSLIRFGFAAFLALFIQACGTGSSGKFGASTAGATGIDALNGGLNGLNGGASGNVGAGGYDANAFKGTSGSGYNGPFGDVSLTFVQNGGGFPSGADQDPTLPYMLAFSGPSKFLTFTCVPFDLKVMNVNKQNIAVPSGMALQVQVRDDGTSAANIGGFFTDSACANGAGTLTFNAGDTSQKIYYKTHVAGIRVLKADGSPGPLIGRFAALIDNNPAMVLNVCFNYEDMYKHGGGDQDYNDVVIRGLAGSGILALSNNVITAYSNGPLQFAFTGTSACQTQVIMRVVLPNGTVFSQASVDDARNGKTATLNFRYGSQLQVFYNSLGGCSTGGYQPMAQVVSDNGLKMTNSCRTAGDEGKHI